MCESAPGSHLYSRIPIITTGLTNSQTLLTQDSSGEFASLSVTLSQNQYFIDEYSIEFGKSSQATDFI
jgi:hypothetical protein